MSVTAGEMMLSPDGSTMELPAVGPLSAMARAGAFSVAIETFPAASSPMPESSVILMLALERIVAGTHREGCGSRCSRANSRQVRVGGEIQAPSHK